MNLLEIAVHEIGHYAWWWLVFIAIAYCSGRYLGVIGLVIGLAAVSSLIVILDLRWVFDDMRNHPEHGRDADFVFWFGVLCRIVLFNVILSPVFFGGLGLRTSAQRSPAPRV